MYAGCSVPNCQKGSRYLIDIKDSNGEIKTHSRCDSHSRQYIETEVLEVIKIHDIVMPLSTGGSGTVFNSGCRFCGDKKADEIIRFRDSFGTVSTEARCEKCVRSIAKKRDLKTRKNIEEISIRTKDFS